MKSFDVLTFFLLLPALFNILFSGVSGKLLDKHVLFGGIMGKFVKKNHIIISSTVLTLEVELSF